MFSRTRAANGMRSPKASVRVIFSARFAAAGATPGCARPRPSPAAAERAIQSRRVAVFLISPPSTHPVFFNRIVVQRYAQAGFLRDVVETVLHGDRLFHQVF